MTSFKVEIQTTGDKWSSNAVRLGTEEEARAYGRQLNFRWAAVSAWRVAEINEPVNYCFADGDLRRLEECDKPA